MRKTSKDAWDSLKRGGRLGQRQMGAYEWLFQNGPATGKRGDKESGMGDTYHKRLSELERMGLVEEVKKDVDPLTGEEATYWDVTDISVPKDVASDVDDFELTPKEMKMALDDIGSLLAGKPPNPVLGKLGKWLNGMIEKSAQPKNPDQGNLFV